MSPTNAQVALLDYLLAEALSDEAAIDRRWGLLPVVRARAASGQLLLVRHWTADIVLSRDGDVIVIDTEDGQAPQLATDRERRLSLFQAIQRYPELLPFLPQRPLDAIECPDCSGKGILPARLANPKFRNLICSCSCGGAGWINAEERRRT